MIRLATLGFLAAAAVGAVPSITFEEIAAPAEEVGPADRAPPAPGSEGATRATLADGRVLAAWVDGRRSPPAEGAGRLFTQTAGAPGSAILVDDAVCACCRPSLVAFPDGSALLAYRGCSADGVRDIRVTRLRGDRWDTPRPLHADGWRTETCPGHGPRIVSDGGRVAAAWFTGAENAPRILVSLSTDAGTRFLLPLQISESKPTGEVAVALLRDAAILVVWVDVRGVLWWRRVSPDFVATKPVPLTRAEEGRVTGGLRIVVGRDFAGGREPAVLQVSFAREGGAARRRLLVTVPEGELIEIEQNCDCASAPELFRGFPLRGVIGELRRDTGTMRIRHYEVPGVLGEGVRDFRVELAKVPVAAQPGREFFGRIEMRDGAWWLFDLRLIAASAR